jgi:hypothetical protein
MSDLADCRSMEKLYFQKAKSDPQNSAKWLYQAERWGDLARHQDAWRLQKRDNRQMHAGPMATQPRTNERPWKQMG